MTDYKSMQKRMRAQGADLDDIYKAVIAEKDRYIAALEVRIDQLKQELDELRGVGFKASYKLEQL